MKISIITATYNSEATLSDTIESVLHQSYKDIEYIVVDGKSDDNTLNIIKEYEPKFYGRMIWISECDKGIYDAMNKGLEMATGDIVGFLNSDDFYTSNFVLQHVNEIFNSNEVLDAVYGDVHFVEHDDLTRCVRYYSSRIFRRELMRLGFMPAHPSFYCKTDNYKKFGGFDVSFKIGADFENLLRLIFINHIKTKYVPIDFVTMRTGGISTSGFKSHRQIMKDHLRAFHKNDVYSNVFLLILRYFYKIMEILKTKVSFFR